MENKEQQILAEIKSMMATLRQQMEMLDAKMAQLQQLTQTDDEEFTPIVLDIDTFAEPIEISTEVPAEVPVDESAEESAEESVEVSLEVPVEEPVEIFMEVPVEEPAEEPEELADELAEELVEGQASDYEDLPTEDEEPAEEPAEEADEEPSDDLPFDLPADEPEEETTEVFAEDPVEEPAEESVDLIVEVEEEPLVESQPEPVVESQPEPVVEKKPMVQEAIIDVMTERQAWRTDMPGTPVKDVRLAISLHERVLFINHLFSEDPMAFQAAVNRVNASESLEQVVEFVKETYPQWNLESDLVYIFMMAVRRKIRS